MSLTLSEYVLRDFAIEHVDSILIVSGDEGKLCLPAADQAYFHLVLSGTANLELESSSQFAELHAGDFALLLYGAAHTIGGMRARRGKGGHYGDGWPGLEAPTIHKLGGGSGELRVLSGRLQLTRVLRTAPVNRALPHLLTYLTSGGSERSHSAIFGDMATLESLCQGPGASAFIFALVHLHLVQVLRQVNEDMRQVMPVSIGDPEMGRMATVLRKIRAHPEKRWTVALLAQEVGCSRSSFAAKFRAYAGVGPIKYVAKSRLNHAASMLKGNPELPLWEVAKRVGYETQGSFTRAFKAQFGVSPRNYVKQLVYTVGEK